MIYVFNYLKRLDRVDIVLSYQGRISGDGEGAIAQGRRNDFCAVGNIYFQLHILGGVNHIKKMYFFFKLR